MPQLIDHYCIVKGRPYSPLMKTTYVSFLDFWQTLATFELSEILKMHFDQSKSAICSALSGVYLGGYHSGIGDTTKSTWEMLWCDLQGVSSSSCLRKMTDTIAASDRGYNCKNVTEFLCNLGVTFIGTYKRSQDCPFSFGTLSVMRKRQNLS